MNDTARSEVESIKQKSRYLRGTLVESLADPLTGDIDPADYQLLKFHGSYRQDDRDTRDDRRRRKLEPDFQYMLRLRLPGGVITSAQWRALDAIAGEFGNGTLRVTTRQSLQLHGIRKSRLKPAIAAINEALLDTYAACGDVNRNVICSVNPAESSVHAAVHAQARVLSEMLLPQSSAYGEIWLDRRPDGPDREPVYGATYLPRKFKIAFAVPPFNDVDVLAHDLGFIAIAESGEVAGYNLAVGGGMGMSYGETGTRPRLADVIGFVTPDRVPDATLAVVAIQREHGNRADRKYARLKYTIETMGLDAFRGELQRRLGFALPKARAWQFTHNNDRFGWVRGENGNWHLTLALPSGRVSDSGTARLRSGLRELAARHAGELRLTANQNLIVANVRPEARDPLDALLTEYGIDAHRQLSALRRHAIACVALPTCGLAMAEAERYLPGFLDRLEERLDRHGLLQQPLLVRISGCPNGCARPYLAEIALTGKAPGRYNLFLGGSHTGDRLAMLYRENIDEAGILAALDALFARFAAEREGDEAFGDFLRRSGVLRGGDFHHPAGTGET